MVSAGKENMDMLSFFIFLSCTERGREIDVAFFWTNLLMRSSLSGGIALFPTFLGLSVSLNTASLQISHLAMERKKIISAHLLA